MKKIIYYLTLLALSSCTTPKNVIYFADAERFQQQAIIQQYSSKIQKDDLLSIIVSSKSPELALPFNPLIALSSSTPGNVESEYLVTSDGEITFPILGKLNVVGLTQDELAQFIEQRIKDEGYINDPTVTVNLKNYKISILGEVLLPGVKRIESNRITIFEALSMSGDLTIVGRRENISILREENGYREIGSIDISSKDVFDSPYYYLHPNDMVYVEPNKKKEKQSVNNPTLLATVFSGAALMVAILTLMLRFN